MKTIELTQGKVAFVDDADFELVKGYKWHCWGNHKKGNLYARTSMMRNNKQVWLMMHNLLMNPVRPLIVDHRNGDSLNNTRENLRVCTVSQNNANRRTKKQKHNDCLYRGVTKRKGYEYYYAYCKGVRLGRFYCEIEAAQAYDTAARTYFGEYACLNFPREGEQGNAPRRNQNGLTYSKAN